MNNPFIYVDPNGEREFHITIPEVNIGLGAEAGTAVTLGFATDGTFGVSTSVHAGGLAGAEVSIGVSIGYSNAETWADTLGAGQYTEIGGKVLGGASVTTNFSDGEYSGSDIGIGLGLRVGPQPIPVTFSGGVSHATATPIHGDLSGILHAVDQVAHNTSNYVKSIF